MKSKLFSIIPFLFTILVVAVIAIIVFAARLYSRVYVGTKLTPTPFPKATIVQRTPQPDQLLNILLLGYGGEGHEGGSLTDTMMLASVDLKKNTIHLISIPRDLWVPIPIKKDEFKYMKINNAYAVGNDESYSEKELIYQGPAGGGNMAKYEVGLVTGVDVNFFISIDFNGFKNIVDILGGVEINLPYDFDDFYYPVKGLEKELCGKTEEDVKNLTATMSGELLEKQFPCRFEHVHFDKGLNNLDSEQALKFVRSRHSQSNGTDFGRSQRQQLFLTAVKDSIVRGGSVLKAIEILDEFSRNIKTDINLKAAYDIAKKKGEISDFEIKLINLTTDNVLKESKSSDGQYILISKDGQGNWGAVQDFIKARIE